MRLSLVLALVALTTALLFGCGGSEDSTTLPQGANRGGAKAEVRAQWEESPACAHPQGASRWGCSVGSYRCQAVVSDRGWSVEVAIPWASMADR